MRTRKEFLYIQNSGKKVRSKHFLFVFTGKSSESSLSTNESRLGVTVTTKIDKRAVRRNLLKRRIREVFRRSRRHLRKPVDLVVIALTGAGELSYRDIRGELLYGLRKARLLPKQNKFS